MYCMRPACGLRAKFVVRAPISGDENTVCGGHLAAAIRDATAGAVLDRTAGAGTAHVWQLNQK